MENKKSGTFWHTQPVTDKKDITGEIQPKKKPMEVPVPLPEGLEWATMDINNDRDMDAINNLLLDNYLSDVKEDEPESFRFAYSIQLLRWALLPPNHDKNWWVGIKKDKKLVAFITAIPMKISVRGEIIEMAEVNFLCVHKKLRSKQMAPILIKEITRRVHLTDKWQAFYTAGQKLPGIFSSATYYHRLINIEKLVKVGFAAPVQNIEARKKELQIKASPLKVRLMELKDVDQCFALFQKHNESNLAFPVFSKDEFQYWLKPLKQTIWTYVYEKDGKILDFVSFYMVFTTAVTFNIKIKIAYLWFYTNVNTEWTELLESALFAAQSNGFDCFNALEGNGGSIQDLESLKFVRGDGTLNYYFYNWKAGDIPNDKVGLFLL